MLKPWPLFHWNVSLSNRILLDVPITSTAAFHRQAIRVLECNSANDDVDLIAGLGTICRSTLLQRSPFPCSFPKEATHRSARPFHRRRTFPEASAPRDNTCVRSSSVDGDHLSPHHDFLLKRARTQLGTRSPLVQPTVRVDVVVALICRPAGVQLSAADDDGPIGCRLKRHRKGSVLVVVLERNALAIGSGVDGHAASDAA